MEVLDKYNSGVRCDSCLGRFVMVGNPKRDSLYSYRNPYKHASCGKCSSQPTEEVSAALSECDHHWKFDEKLKIEGFEN
jgi:hypothetical protein